MDEVNVYFESAEGLTADPQSIISLAEEDHVIDMQVDYKYLRLHY